MARDILFKIEPAKGLLLGKQTKTWFDISPFQGNLGTTPS